MGKLYYHNIRYTGSFLGGGPCVSQVVLLGEPMSQSIIKTTSYCEFLGRGCIRTNCPSFVLSTPLTIEDRERLSMSDIPIVDPCKHNWCSRYNCHVGNVYKIIGKCDNRKSR